MKIKYKILEMKNGQFLVQRVSSIRQEFQSIFGKQVFGAPPLIEDVGRFNSLEDARSYVESKVAKKTIEETEWSEND